MCGGCPVSPCKVLFGAFSPSLQPRRVGAKSKRKPPLSRLTYLHGSTRAAARASRATNLAHRTPGADAVNMAADARNTWRARPASVRAVATDTKPALRASGAATEPCALAPGRGRGRKDPLARTSCFGPGRGHRHKTRAVCLPSSYGALRACSGPWPRTQESLGAHVLLRSGPWSQTLLRAVAADARIPWRASVWAVATDTKPAARASRAATPGALGRARCCKIFLARSSCWSRPWPQALRASRAATEPCALAPGCGPQATPRAVATGAPIVRQG